MTDELELGIPEAEDEPKPYTVKVWRKGEEILMPFALEADAISFAVGMEHTDECWVGGIFDPAGNKVQVPWQRPRE